MQPLFPTSSDEIDRWCRQYKVATGEAKKRFVQYVVLESIASTPILARAIMFKGGNALRFIYGNRRGTIDLDFSADATFPDDEGQIRLLLDETLRFALPRFRVKARCQRIKRRPPGREHLWTTYAISVGYLLPGDRLYNNFDESKLQMPAIIEVEISINEVVCDIILTQLGQNSRDLRVCSLEDIIAEKLRALLQQPRRNRSRPQDVFDIASVLQRHGGELDLEKVSRFLILKAEAREINPRKTSFDDIVRELASVDYQAQIEPTTPDFIPFDEAWLRVQELVAKLAIPD